MNEIDLRLLRAAVAVAEELNFSRAATRLHITQPALTKQIQDLEEFLKNRLFDRDHQRVALTDAGRAFVAEAKLSLLHQQRAIQAARSAAEGAEAVLNIGESPYIDPLLRSLASSVHLSLYPSLKLHVFSDYSPELSRRVATGDLDVAIVTAVNESRQLSAVELMSSPFYIALQRESNLARKRELTLQDLTGLPWILFAQQVNPTLYDAISERSLELKTEPCERHHATSAEQAAQLVKSTGGVAFLTKQGAWRVAVDGITIRPLAEPDLQVKTIVRARNDAGRLVSEFVRALVRKVKAFGEPAQATLPLAI